MRQFPLEKFSDRQALLNSDTGKKFSYQDLLKPLPNERSLLFLFCHNSPEDVLYYVSGINQGHVVCLLDKKMHVEFRKNLIETYQPQIIIEDGSIQRTSFEIPRLHPDLALLMTTSGTTGSPKMIRLSYENLFSNARAIIHYLKIDANEMAIGSLPIHYSYGLSVLNSHLLAGASLALTQESVVQADFWKGMSLSHCTSFAGVPYTYRMLDRIGFDAKNYPHLKTMTQAGGALEKELIVKFDSQMKSKGGLFFVMYGQTEATARISFLDPVKLPAKAGFIGQAIPGGRLSLVNGELVYEGPNVMLGYAEKVEDLEKGDLQKGILYTGDLAIEDSDGDFAIVGRLKRISKIYGYRINLDEIEKEIQQYGIGVVISDDQKIAIYFEKEMRGTKTECIKMLSEKYSLHYSTFEIKTIDRLPRLPSGKIDYKALGGS